jgi:hypothetical protein
VLGGLNFAPSAEFRYNNGAYNLLGSIVKQMWLELDDGKTIHLERGDVVVQNGTRRAWRNKRPPSLLPPSVMASLIVE